MPSVWHSHVWRCRRQHGTHTVLVWTGLSAGGTAASWHAERAPSERLFQRRRGSHRRARAGCGCGGSMVRCCRPSGSGRASSSSARPRSLPESPRFRPDSERSTSACACASAPSAPHVRHNTRSGIGRSAAAAQNPPATPRRCNSTRVPSFEWPPRLFIGGAALIAAAHMQYYGPWPVIFKLGS
jgi:hypothetical protein